METFYFLLIVIGLVIILILICGYPRKKNERVPSLEGLDDPHVAKAFGKMTKLPPFKLLHRKVISKVKEFEPNGRLVDIGCGSGNLIVRLAKKYPSLELIGVDISSEILELAKKQAIEKNVDEKIEFKGGTVERLPFPDKSIDFIVSTLSLHHWVNPIKVFEEIRRVLKENGTFLIFDFRRDSRKIYYGLLTFATKIVVPKPLKNINEPLGSLLAGYTRAEILEISDYAHIKDIKINTFLAWMFIHNGKN